MPSLELAAIEIKRGKLVAFPTETVYGLGASVYLSDAIDHIFALKGRPSDNPLIVHISDLSQLDDLVESIPKEFFPLAERFWPGPLTILMPKKEGISDRVTAGLSTIAIRMPSHPIAKGLIEAAGVPIVAPSANRSGRPSATRAEHVRADFGEAVMILEGECGIGLESTVLQLDPFPMILRPGTVSAGPIAEVLGVPVVYANQVSDQPASPGMKYRHYAPQAKVTIVSSPIQTSSCQRLLFPTPARLYADLRQADIDGIQEIVIVCDEQVTCDLALMNRIEKAASSKQS